MYCRECGKQVNEKAEICTSCGVRPLNGDAYCQDCGVKTTPKQELCTRCGVRLKVYNNNTNHTTFRNLEGSATANSDFSNLTEYYQKEFTKIYESNEKYKGRFNWAAFWLGPLWAVIKGAWLNALLTFFAIVLTGGLFGVLVFIVGIYYGFRGNYIHYNVYAKGKQTTF